jgi:hypothetical protein
MPTGIFIAFGAHPRNIRPAYERRLQKEAVQPAGPAAGPFRIRRPAITGSMTCHLKVHSALMRDQLWPAAARVAAMTRALAGRVR